MNPIDQDRNIEMTWEDMPPFEAILFQFGLTEADVITLMRKSLKRSSFNWLFSITRNHERSKESRLTHQALCALQQAIHLEEKMGKGLGRIKILQWQMQKGALTGLSNSASLKPQFFNSVILSAR